jgi:glycosyltransferase involved in cell wall biosynthesis
MSFVKEAIKVKHKYSPPLREKFEQNKPIFTVIIDAYFNKKYLKQAVESVQNQTYQNIELILVDNASIEDVPQYLEDIYQTAINVKLIKFKENQFSHDGVEVDKAVSICWNSALHYAKGDYIFHLDYDDYLSNNFVQRMVQLFLNNDHCTTATGLPCIINDKGDIVESSETSNKRGLYTSGFDIAADILDKRNKNLCSLRGGTFVVKKEYLIKIGGYDRMIDLLQYFKILPFGVSGYDKYATYYRRVHRNQFNLIFKKSGCLWYKAHMEALNRSNVITLWRKEFGDYYALKLQAYSTNAIEGMVFSILGISLVSINIKTQIKTLINIQKQCPHLLGRALWNVIKFYLLLPKFFVGKMLKREHKERIKLFLSKKNVY